MDITIRQQKSTAQKSKTVIKLSKRISKDEDEKKIQKSTVSLLYRVIDMF